MSYRQQAMHFLATYDHENADAYELHMCKISRIWIQLMSTPEPAEDMVINMLEDFKDEKPEGYGCGWDELRKAFERWAHAEFYEEEEAENPERKSKWDPW